MKTNINYTPTLKDPLLDETFMNRLSRVPLTTQLIAALPKVDLHVHLPGTISPLTAWKLGVKNRLITVNNGQWSPGPQTLGAQDPHRNYSEVFLDLENNTLGEDGLPHPLKYNITPHNFKSFDRVMATVQGHRSPPGGIQREEDLILVLMEYLKDCLAQNIFYTEVQQNIRIAYHLYPTLSPKEARYNLYKVLQAAAQEYAKSGVHLRFLHCFNKTQAAGLAQSTSDRALEAAQWLQESHKIAPGLFVGVEAAGHEKDEQGWPIHLKEGYEAVASLGLGCEAHGGEGIGVEHMMDIANTLPITRIAHGFQVIERASAITDIIAKDITLVMSPVINLSLGACVHYCPVEGKPLARSEGGHKHYIRNLGCHPFFALLRNHPIKISLCSDNPEMAGVPIQVLMTMLAGLPHDQTSLPKEWLECHDPLKTHELVQILIHGIEAAFCESSLKEAYKDKLWQVIHDHMRAILG
jgi:adenine deaminase